MQSSKFCSTLGLYLFFNDTCITVVVEFGLFTCSYLSCLWGTCRQPLRQTINLTKTRWSRPNGHFILILNEGTIMAIVHLVQLHVNTLECALNSCRVVVSHSPLPSAANARLRRWVQWLQTVCPDSISCPSKAVCTPTQCQTSHINRHHVLLVYPEHETHHKDPQRLKFCSPGARLTPDQWSERVLWSPAPL